MASPSCVARGPGEERKEEESVVKESSSAEKKSAMSSVWRGFPLAGGGGGVDGCKSTNM